MKRMFLLFCLAGCASSKTETMNIHEYRPAAAAKKPTVYMFSTDECEPCREAKPVLEREARLRGDRVIIVDAEDFRLMKRLGYSSLPVFRFVKPGSPDLIVKGWDKKRFVKAYQHFDDGVMKRESAR
jgi:thiol-disulfide isomerase/thioredoxin